MERFDSLEIFAEIGIALAGFSGVAAAIAGRSPAGLHPRQRIGFWSVVSIGFAIAILALLPRALASFGISEHAVWRALCVLEIPCFVATWFLVWRYHRQLERTGYPSGRRWLYPILGLIVALLSVALLLAALRVLPGFGVYYSSLVVLIGLGANSFILFLLVSHE